MKLSGRLRFTAVEAYCKIEGSKYASEVEYEKFASEVKGLLLERVRSSINNSGRVHVMALAVPKETPAGVVISVTTSGTRSLTIEETKQIRSIVKQVKKEMS